MSGNDERNIERKAGRSEETFERFHSETLTYPRDSQEGSNFHASSWTWASWRSCLNMGDIKYELVERGCTDFWSEGDEENLVLLNNVIIDHEKIGEKDLAEKLKAYYNYIVANPGKGKAMLTSLTKRGVISRRQ